MTNSEKKQGLKTFEYELNSSKMKILKENFSKLKGDSNIKFANDLKNILKKKDLEGNYFRKKNPSNEITSKKFIQSTKGF